MIENRRTDAAKPPDHEVAVGAATGSLRDQKRGLDGWLATPLIAIVAVVCCAFPLLLGALAASGTSAWLAARGYTIAAAAMVVVAAILGWRIRVRLSRG